MDSRSLNRLVVLQRPSGAVDALNQPVPGGWTDVATVWANVRFLNGIETVKSDAPVSVVQASVRIRRRTDVAARMRALEVMRLVTVTGITKANPAVVTAPAHGLVAGQPVRIDLVQGMTQVNAKLFDATPLTADTFSIGVDSTAYGAYTSGGKGSLVAVFDIKAVLPDEEDRERLDLVCETGQNDG